MTSAPDTASWSPNPVVILREHAFCANEGPGRTAQSFSRTLRECKSARLARFLNAAYDPHARTPDAPSACESSAPSTRTKLGACCCEPHHSIGIVIPNEALLLLPREGSERAVRMPRVCCAAISRTLGAHPNWRETGEPLSGERMQPTAQAVGRVQRRRKPQRGERN